MCMCVCVAASVMSSPVWPYGLQPARNLCPWDSSGKNTGVGYGAGYPHTKEGTWTFTIHPTQKLKWMKDLNVEAKTINLVK